MEPVRWQPDAISQFICEVRHPIVQNDNISFLPILQHQLNTLNVKLVSCFLGPNLIAKRKHVLELDVEVVLNQFDQLIGVFFLRRCPGNKFKDVRRNIQKGFEVLSEADKYS